MAGEIQLNSTTMATESSGTITLSNINSATNRTNLGLGSMATQAADSVSISGGNITGGTIGSSVVFPSFVGMIASFAMSSAPTGWLACNGAEYAIADYGDLYTATGTTWGALTNGSGGAGSTHFRVPDLRGAFLRGTGTGTINTRNKAGGSVGDFNEDQYQGHIHQFTGLDKDGNGNNFNYTHSGSGEPRTGPVAGDYVGDAEINSQGTPRTGVETFPYNATVQYCIKY